MGVRHRALLVALAAVACCAMIAIESAGALRTTTRTVLASVSSFVRKGLDLDTAQTVLSRAPYSTDLGDFFLSLPASSSLAKKGLDLETAQAKLNHVLASHVQTLKNEQDLMLEHKGEVDDDDDDDDDDSGYKGAHIGVQGSSNTIAFGHHAEASSHTSIVLVHDACDCCGHVECGCCRQISEGSYGDEPSYVYIESKVTFEKPLTDDDQFSVQLGYAKQTGVPVDNVEIRQSYAGLYVVTVKVKDASDLDKVKKNLADSAALAAAITTAVLIFPPPLPTFPSWHTAVCSTVRPNSS